MTFKITHIEAKSINIWLRYEPYDKSGKSSFYSFYYALLECDCSNLQPDNDMFFVVLESYIEENLHLKMKPHHIKKCLI